ncbi:glycerol-1-phosphatase [Wallemia mellicola]|nr:glycerol-1-phosphatase [Wallemia mellicola]
MCEYQDLPVKGVLSDMDGTLIESTPAVEATWAQFAQDYPFISLEDVLKHSHGVRTHENMIRFCKLENPDTIASEAKRFEETILACAKKRQEQGLNGLVILPGVNELLDQLNDNHNNWTIVTSATKVYASAALSISQIKQPEFFITSENVVRGKPDPSPFLEGAKVIKQSATDCLVLEDAPSGITAGKAAGAVVIAVLTSYPIETIKASGPDFIVKDLSSVSAKWTNDHYEITVDAIDI